MVRLAFVRWACRRSRRSIYYHIRANRVHHVPPYSIFTSLCPARPALNAITHGRKYVSLLGLTHPHTHIILCHQNNKPVTMYTIYGAQSSLPLLCPQIGVYSNECELSACSRPPPTPPCLSAPAVV